MALARMASAGSRPRVRLHHREATAERRVRRQPLPEALRCSGRRPAGHRPTASVVEARSNSRNSRVMSEEMVTCKSGGRVGQAGRVARSVRRVDEGIEETDGDGLVAAGFQRRHQAPAVTSATSSGVSRRCRRRGCARRSRRKLARVTTGVGF